MKNEDVSSEGCRHLERIPQITPAPLRIFPRYSSSKRIVIFGGDQWHHMVFSTRCGTHVRSHAYCEQPSLHLSAEESGNASYRSQQFSLPCC